MFDIRKIQEQVIYKAVKSVSNDESAREIVYGKGEIAKEEDNPTWVKSTMKRLENHFDKSDVFEKAFECKVDVELLKSIKMGDEICLMKIIPKGTIWK